MESHLYDVNSLRHEICLARNGRNLAWAAILKLGMCKRVCVGFVLGWVVFLIEIYVIKTGPAVLAGLSN